MAARIPETATRERTRAVTKDTGAICVDPATIQDHATFAEPQQYSTGVRDVFVNGVQVLKAGEHTGATPGRVVRGAGWTGWKQ